MNMKRKSQMVRSVVCVLVASVLVGFVNPQEGERAITRGCNPAFSPDGRRIAFQRLDGEVFKIGVGVHSG